MDRSRIRTALMMSCMLSVFMLSTRQISMSHAQSKTSSKPVLKASGPLIDRKNYVGQWTIEDQVQGQARVLVRSFNISDSSYIIEVKTFYGDWDDDDWKAYQFKGVFFNTSTDPIYFQNNISTKIINQNIIETTGNALFKFNSWNNISGEVHLDQPDFKFRFTAAVNYYEELTSRVYYTIILGCTYIFAFIAIGRHAHQCNSEILFAEKTSMLTLGVISIHELGFSLWQLKIAFAERIAFDYLFISFFVSLVSFGLVYSKIVPEVYKAQSPQLNSYGFHISSRIVSNYQHRFLLLTLISIISIKILSEFSEFFYCLAYLFFLPQIIRNSIMGFKDSISITNVTCYLFSKLVLGLYLFGCPENFMNYKPNYKICAVIVLITVTQALILYWQRFKPRFLVPKKFRPFTYDYFKDEREIKIDEDLNCIICMTPLNLRVNQSEEILNKSKTMFTPCKHKFHETCLKQWMTIKLECPTCRTTLPRLEE